MAKKQLTDFTDSELITELSKAKQELFKIRFQFATGQLENTTLLKGSKKKIAKVMTEVRSREIAAAEALASVDGGL